MRVVKEADEEEEEETDKDEEFEAVEGARAGVDTIAGPDDEVDEDDEDDPLKNAQSAEFVVVVTMGGGLESAVAFTRSL